MLVPYIFSVLALYSCSNILLETQKFKHTHTHTHTWMLSSFLCVMSLDIVSWTHFLDSTDWIRVLSMLTFSSEGQNTLPVSIVIELPCRCTSFFFFFLAFYGGSTDLLVAPPEKFIAICFLPQGWRQYLSLWLLPSKEENSAYKGFIGLAQDH